MNPCLLPAKKKSLFVADQSTRGVHGEQKKIIYILTLHNELYTLYMPL